jgi:hypothetical protein
VAVTVGLLLSASLSLTACGGSGGATSGAATSGSPATAPDGAAPKGPLPSEASGDTSGTTTTPSGRGPGTAAATTPFCTAAALLQQGPPPNATPEQEAQFVQSVEAAADEMIATAPDRAIVPVVESLKKAFGLYTALALADPNEDPAAFQARAEEAERLFPADQQRQFAEFVKDQCGIELRS